jgi:hypothetical protein
MEFIGYLYYHIYSGILTNTNFIYPTLKPMELLQGGTLNFEMEVLLPANNGIKKGGIFMKNIIDDPINKNIELYSAFFQFVSIITLQKISTIETRKNELKDQMKNSYQKNPYYL